jgi:predicted nucleotidyltransferase
MRVEPDLDLARRFVADSAIPGRLLLGGITGSHHYGFPSPDSDLDIKAIHVAPTESFLGLAAPRDAYERLEVFEGVECDLTSNEARQALALLLRGNGNLLERILCPYQLVEGPEVEALQALAAGAVCRRFHGHYSGFFRAMCHEFERTESPTAKQVLYAFRVAATGIHLLRTGRLEADLGVLAGPYGVPEALPLIEVKRSTAEKVLLDRSDAPRYRQVFERLGRLLEDALATSPLPEEPPNREACERWLIDLRKAELERSSAPAGLRRPPGCARGRSG